MDTIWKYPIEINDIQTISLPVGAEILCVQTQNDRPYIWALVDSEAETESCQFLLCGTGERIPANLDHLEYIGTFQQMGGLFVWHLFKHFELPIRWGEKEKRC
jgi:hypothetical protein